MDVSKATRVTFQNQEAFELVERQDGSWLDEPPRFTYRLVFERGEMWYSIWYHIFEDTDLLPLEIRRYIETFQAEAEAASDEIDPASEVPLGG